VAIELHADRVDGATGKPPMPDDQTVQPSKALYYPHFEFRPTAWVKSALLYWEAIVRMRLPGSSPQDDAETQQLMAAGLVEEEVVAPLRRQLTPELGQRVEELMRAHGGCLPSGIPRVGRLRGVSLEAEERARREIVDDLGGYPLARKAFAGELAQVRTLLFTFLVDKIGGARGLVPVTDDPVFDAIAIYFGEEGLTKDPTKLTEADGSSIAQLCLPAPSLEALSELPVERLLEIREKYAAQRHHFRERVQAQVTTIAELPTREAIEGHLKAFQEEIHNDFDAAREAVKGANVKERWTLLGIGAQASMIAGASLAASPVLASIGGIGTLAFGVTDWFVKKRERSNDPQGHYLLSLDAAVKDPWRRLTRAFGALVGE
jgi:hypothetical protein